LLVYFCLSFCGWLGKKLNAPGQIFGLYLMMNGVERFLVEKIRVNTTYNIFGYHPTQAELISTMLFFMGVWIWIDAVKKHKTKTA